MHSSFSNVRHHHDATWPSPAMIIVLVAYFRPQVGWGCLASHAAFAESTDPSAPASAGAAALLPVGTTPPVIPFGVPHVGMSCFASQTAFAASSEDDAAAAGAASATGAAAAELDVGPQEGRSCLASHAAFAAASSVDAVGPVVDT